MTQQFAAANNQPGALSARTLKALCEVLHGDPRRDGGLALLEAFDSIDLMAIQDASAVDVAVKKVGRVQVMVDRIEADLSRLLPQKSSAQKTVSRETIIGSGFEFPIGHRCCQISRAKYQIPASRRISSLKRDAKASSL